MLGRLLLTLDSVMLIAGTWLADYNHSHIFNTRWPPHAKFHAGQTISISTILGVVTLLLAWRPQLLARRGIKLLPEQTRDTLIAAGFTGSLYWIAGLMAKLYPNTDGLDLEFGGPGFPQRGPFILCAGFALVGAAWEILTLA